MRLQALVTLVYAILVLAGGVMGYLKAQSTPSLVSGIGFGVALLFSGWFIWQDNQTAAYLAIGLTLLIAAFFSYRFLETGKFMPAGLVLILSLLTLAILWLGIRK